MSDNGSSDGYITGNDTDSDNDSLGDQDQEDEEDVDVDVNVRGDGNTLIDNAERQFADSSIQGHKLILRNLYLPCMTTLRSQADEHFEPLLDNEVVTHRRALFYVGFLLHRKNESNEPYYTSRSTVVRYSIAFLARQYYLGGNRQRILWEASMPRSWRREIICTINRHFNSALMVRFVKFKPKKLQLFLCDIRLAARLNHCFDRRYVESMLLLNLGLQFCTRTSSVSNLKVTSFLLSVVVNPGMEVTATFAFDNVKNFAPTSVFYKVARGFLSKDNPITGEKRDYSVDIIYWLHLYCLQLSQGRHGLLRGKSTQRSLFPWRFHTSPSIPTKEELYNGDFTTFNDFVTWAKTNSPELFSKEWLFSIKGSGLTRMVRRMMYFLEDKADLVCFHSLKGGGFLHITLNNCGLLGINNLESALKIAYFNSNWSLNFSNVLENYDTQNVISRSFCSSAAVFAS